MYFCVLSSCALLERLQWSRGDGQLQGWNQVGFAIVVNGWWWKWGMVKITIMQVLIVMVMNGEDNNDAGGRLTSWSSATLPRTPSWPRWPFHRGHRGLDEEDYHQVGDVDADHGFWGRPEDMNMARSAPITTLCENGCQDHQPNSWPRWSGQHSPSAQATPAQIWQGGSPYKTAFWSFWYQGDY